MKRILSVLLILLLLCACVQKPQTEAAQATAPVETGNTPEPDVTQADETPAPDRDDPVPVVLGFDMPEIGGYSDFAYTLSAALLSGAENRNLSPISVYFALAMVSEGADGKTLSDLLKLLGCSDLESLRETAGNLATRLTRETQTGELTLCNSLWTGEMIPVRTEYRARLRELYGAEAETVPFGTDETGERIAAWIREKTSGLITPAPDAMKFDPLTVAVLLNTIYFRDQWETPFSEYNRQSGIFTLADGTEQTLDYLHRLTGDTHICRGDGFLRYSVRFESKGQITFVLPDEGVALTDLLGTPDRLRTLLIGGECFRADVDLFMPKFAFPDKYELAPMLAALGLDDAFTDDADFSGMSSYKAKIDRVIQETVIDLNETGVEAAGYTEILMAPGEAAPPNDPEKLPLIEFRLNRPFLFVIEGSGGTPLFVGTVADPSPVG